MGGGIGIVGNANDTLRVGDVLVLKNTDGRIPSNYPTNANAIAINLQTPPGDSTNFVKDHLAAVEGYFVKGIPESKPATPEELIKTFDRICYYFPEIEGPQALNSETNQIFVARARCPNKNNNAECTSTGTASCLDDGVVDFDVDIRSCEDGLRSILLD